MVALGFNGDPASDRRVIRLPHLPRRCRANYRGGGDTEGEVVGACCERSLGVRHRERHRRRRGAWRSNWKRRGTGNRWCQQWWRFRSGGLGWPGRPRWFGRRHERRRRPCRFGRCGGDRRGRRFAGAMPAEAAREAAAARLGNKLREQVAARATAPEEVAVVRGALEAKEPQALWGSGGQAGSAGAGTGGVSGTGGVTGSGGTAGAGGAAGAPACASTCTIDSVRCGPLTQIMSCQAQSDECFFVVRDEDMCDGGSLSTVAGPGVLRSALGTMDRAELRCRRGEGGAFIRPITRISGDGTVLDDVTHLMWQKTIDGANTSPPPRYSWPKALGYCGFLRLAGYDDWRLPSAVELQSIVDYGRSKPSIDSTVFPNTPAGTFWTSTAMVNPAGWAWIVIHDARTTQTRSSDETYSYVRCVR